MTAGATALPMREAACVMPCAKPRFSLATQRDIAAVAAGKRRAFAEAEQQRATSIDDQAAGQPVSIVATAQTAPQAISVRFAPKRSLTQPPMIWNTRYG
jgi:hypothetical protein